MTDDEYDERYVEIVRNRQIHIIAFLIAMMVALASLFGLWCLKYWAGYTDAKNVAHNEMVLDELVHASRPPTTSSSRTLVNNSASSLSSLPLAAGVSSFSSRLSR